MTVFVFVAIVIGILDEVSEKIMRKNLGIGLAGFGVVGRGVYEVLAENGSLIAERANADFSIQHIICRHPERVQSIVGPSITVGSDTHDLIKDPNVDIVIEVMGGIEPAKSLILGALQSGKSVITANKALLALHGNEIFDCAKRFDKNVYFEAAVAGGIPIIKTLREGLTANRIDSIVGIINGTTNFILSAMQENALTFPQALQLAQQKGYAEADPTFDIEGLDAGHKIALLASFAFNTPVHFMPENVEGITKITTEDIAFAQDVGCSIKLLAIAKNANGKIQYSVHPTLVDNDHFLAHVDGAMNGVFVQSNALGPSFYYGAGAGSHPTASAVIADLVDCARGNAPMRPTATAEASYLPPEEIESQYYLRIANGQSQYLQNLLNNLRVPIEKETFSNEYWIALTKPIKEKTIQLLLNKLNQFEGLIGPVKVLRKESMSMEA